MTFGMNLGENLTMAASTSSDMFFIAIDYKDKTNMKVAASNINIKISELFSKQQILGVHVTSVSGLDKNLSLNNVYLFNTLFTVN